MNQLFVIALLRWASVAWAAVVTMMLIGSVIASFLITESFGEGLMRLTQIYGGLARMGYDDAAEAAPALGNAVVILLLYLPAFVLYALHENLRRKPEKERE